MQNKGQKDVISVQRLLINYAICMNENGKHGLKTSTMLPNESSRGDFQERPR